MFNGTIYKPGIVLGAGNRVLKLTAEVPAFKEFTFLCVCVCVCVCGVDYANQQIHHLMLYESENKG